MFGSAAQAGQFIRFTYTPPRNRVRTKFGVPQQPSDPRKEVMVLNPQFAGKMHAIDLARITPAEVQVLRAIMDPKNKQTFDQTGQLPQGAPTYPLLLDIFRRMDPVQLIRSPMAFYSQFVKPFIRDKDCYRQYFPQYMSGIQVIKESQVRGAVFNPNPLFKKL